MIIKSIELNNIRSYKSEKIEFKEGINFISGDIGSGKSSILQAIEFALFGFKKGDLEAFQLLRKGENKASIKLILKNKKNDSQIEICRNLKASKADVIAQVNGHIIENENLIELSPQELNAYVFKTLNFPKEFLTKDKNLIYRFTIYTPQEQLKEILFTENDKRLEIIRKIFGIDKYKLICDAVNIYSKKIREDKKVYQTRLEPAEKYSKEVIELNRNISESQNKIKAYLKKEDEFISKQKQVKEAILKRDEHLGKLNEKLIIYEKEKSKIESLQIQEKKLNEKILEVQKFIEKNPQNELKIIEQKLLEMLTSFKKDLVQISENKIKCEKSQDRFKKLIEEKEKLNKQVFEFKSKKDYLLEFQKTFDYVLTQCQVKDLENYIKKDEKNLKKIIKIEEELNKLNENRIEKTSKLELLNVEIRQLNEKKSNISKIKKCENCMQEVNEKHKDEIKNKLLKEINEKEELKEKLLIKIEEITKEISLNNSKLKEFGDVKTSLIEKEEKLKLLIEKEEHEKKSYEKLKLLKKEINELENQKFEEKLDIIKIQLKDLEKIQENIEILNKKELEINKQINENKLQIQEIKQKQERIDQKQEELQSLELELKEINKILQNSGKLSENFKKIEESSFKYLNEKKTLESSLDKLNENLKLISNKTAALTNEIEMTQKQISIKEKELKELKEVEIKLEKLLTYETFLTGKLVNITTEIEKKVFTKYYIEFNELFIEIFRELIEDNEIDVRLNGEFSPVIEQNGFDTDVKNLSGGEKASLSIAYRLGLKKVIENNLESSQKLSLLVLDEPTDGLSEAQIQRFGNILKDSKINQIIAVSHDEKMEAIADTVLRIEKVNHESKIV